MKNFVLLIGFISFFTSTSQIEGAQIRTNTQFKLTKLFAGQDFACGTDKGGIAYCWGNNEYGQSGPNVPEDGFRPRKVSKDLKFRSLAMARNTTCGIEFSGELYCWGAMYGYQFIKKVESQIRFETIYGGDQTFCGISEADRKTYCWGRENFPIGILGHKSIAPEDVASPKIPVPGSHRFDELAVGSSTSCGREGTKIFCWPDFDHGELKVYENSPDFSRGGVGKHEIRSLANHNASPGGDRLCGLDERGNGWCWMGMCAYGGCGRGLSNPWPGLWNYYTSWYSPQPVWYVADGTSPIRPPHPFAALSIGGRHSCALDAKGIPLCYGLAVSGQLGSGEEFVKSDTPPEDCLSKSGRVVGCYKPRAVKSDRRFSTIVSGAAFSCALEMTSGQPYCWGDFDGRGQGNQLYGWVPTKVSPE